MTKNVDIRKAAAQSGVRLWEIANALSPPITDGNFSRKLRNELPVEEKKVIFTIIQNLESERVKQNG